jgi:hypothetical protein
VDIAFKTVKSHYILLKKATCGVAKALAKYILPVSFVG